MNEDSTRPIDQADVDDTAPGPKRLTQHVLEVILKDAPEPVRVTTSNPDLVAWDMTRTKHGWPQADEAPMLWMTFLAWRALKRTGQTTSRWEDFHADLCLDIGMVKETEPDPTRMGRVVA